MLVGLQTLGIETLMDIVVTCGSNRSSARKRSPATPPPPVRRCMTAANTQSGSRRSFETFHCLGGTYETASDVLSARGGRRGRVVCYFRRRGCGRRAVGMRGSGLGWVGSSRTDQGWVSDTDSYSADIRQHLNLPHLPADSVSIVTDSATCARAALAYGRNLNVPDTTTSRQVFVVRVGPTRYIVVDPNVSNGEFLINMVFDSSFSIVFATVAH